MEGELFRHICKVCRRGVGDRFELLCEGRVYLVEIHRMDKKKALAHIIQQRKINPLPKPHIHLALSLCKFQTLDKIIEKSVELGVKTLQLFHSDFSFIKTANRDLEKRENRWNKIIKGATQQTGRGELMKLEPIKPLELVLKEFGKKKNLFGLMAYEEKGSINSLKRVLKQMPRKLDQVWLFVGSEGGFSPKDLELFKNYNIFPVGLGPQVLRVETACIMLLSILKYHLGEDHYEQ